MSRPNVFDAEFGDGYDAGDPPGYRTAEVPFGKVVGGKELTVRLFEIGPGQSLCPYHYEYVEEWLLVIVGDVRVRTPDGTWPASAGDVACFPAGPAGAHKVTNISEQQVARVVMFSPATLPNVAVYPDSGKVGVWTPEPSDDWMFRRADGNVEYFEGELPADS
jgi:uncharacterized cupin superfamily protein